MAAQALAALLLLEACGAAAPPPQAPAQSAKTAEKVPPERKLAQGEHALRLSRYDEAEKALREAIAEGQRGAAELVLAEVLLLTGRYADAETTAKAAAEHDPKLSLRAGLIQAQSLRRRGALDRAEAVLKSHEGDPEARAHRLLLGEILIESGRRKEATAPLMTLIEDYNEDRIRDDDAAGMALVGRAAHLLRSPRDANDAFNGAEKAGPPSRELLLWRAELFLEKYDPGHAEEVLTELLEQAPNDPDALVGLAQVRLDQALDFDEAERLARRALSFNPNLPEAYFVLAGIALRDMELDAADKHVAAGLAVNPRHLPLGSLRAAVRFLAEDSAGFATEKARVFALNPEYSRFFAIVGEHADWEHRYDEIVAMMQEAVTLDPDDALASASLGVNLIRAGRELDGVGALSKAFSLDPYNVRVFNTLNLFDKVIPKTYVTVPGARFTIRYHEADKPVLERYVPRWLEAAWARMVEHYAFTPETPIGVELYAERENFAIRTTGLPETAIQGVCFGKTLASMSPQNETFNLGMTLWHELAHVFHIQMSKSRVPRWFTEGLAEYETFLERPEWTREHDPDLFDMQRAGRLPSLGRMSRAFTRAEQLSDVATAYYASSQIVAELGKQYGMPKLSEMLRAWGRGLPTEEVFRQVLGATTAEVDRRFAKELERRFGRYRSQFVPLSRAPNLRAARDAVEANPKDAGAQIRLAISALRAGEIEEARYALENAKKLDPKQQDARFLDARLLFAAKKPREAVKALRALAADGGDGYDVQMALAQAARAAGDLVALRESLEAARKFDPTQTEPLYGLLELNAQGGSPEREFELVSALSPLAEHDADVHRRLLGLLVERGAWKEAVEVGERAVYADVMGLETHLLYAQALAGAGDKVQALFEAETATLCRGEPPEQAEAFAYYAELLLASGKRDKARAAARRAKELDPSNARLANLAL
jgi:tetratricopeptide (TPR) repeat protein